MNQSKDISFRVEPLKILRQAILENEVAITPALHSGLRKSDYEA
jgi:hypothetical protein